MIMFLKLGFSQTVAQKLVEDQGIYSPCTLASPYNEDISAICKVIRRPGGLINRRIPDKGKQTSVLAARNIMLAMFMFKRWYIA